MAMFSKADPAEKRQRELEAKLKDKRGSRDNLIERRKSAEASAATHREKARRLAGDGADDAALSAAESAMRREQDRAATLGDALGDVETTIGNLEREIAQIIEQRCRAETAAAVTALADKWATAGAAFDATVGELADLARESATIVLDAHPLKVFLVAVKQQVPPEAGLVSRVLRDHAKAVLAGTAPNLFRPTKAMRTLKLSICGEAPRRFILNFYSGASAFRRVHAPKPNAGAVDFDRVAVDDAGFANPKKFLPHGSTLKGDLLQTRNTCDNPARTPIW